MLDRIYPRILLGSTTVANALNPAQMDVLTALRGDPGCRPAVRAELRTELRSEIESALRDIEGPLTIEKSALDKVHRCEGRFLAQDTFRWNSANAKGTVAHKAIELSVGGRHQISPRQLFEAAMTRLCESPESQSIAEYIRSVGDDERAELRVGVIDVIVKFLEMFPPLKDEWWPNAEATTAAYVGERRIVYRGKIDLKLGRIDGTKSNTLIIDIKTGNPSFTDMDDLRFYALLETLRTGAPPFRWANVYVSSGRLDHEDVREDILWSAARRLVDGTRAIAALSEGRPPRLTPGSGCRFCPANVECPVASTDTTRGSVEHDAAATI